jgi:hypothetical protein
MQVWENINKYITKYAELNVFQAAGEISISEKDKYLKMV